MNANATAIEDAVKRHIKDLEDKGKSWGTRAAVFNALWKFCKVNKLKEVDFDEIRKRLGDDETERNGAVQPRHHSQALRHRRHSQEGHNRHICDVGDKAFRAAAAEIQAH